eukprot:3939083-Rhodomonas_salina.3
MVRLGFQLCDRCIGSQEAEFKAGRKEKHGWEVCHSPKCALKWHSSILVAGFHDNNRNSLPNAADGMHREKVGTGMGSEKGGTTEIATVQVTTFGQSNFGNNDFSATGAVQGCFVLV